MRKIFTILVIIFIFTGCEDKIDLDVPDGSTLLVVDGYMSNGDSTQKVTLSTTSPYFESNRTPRVSGAVVYVTTNANDTLAFTESIPGSGDYEAFFDMMKDTTLIYTLNIEVNGKHYRSYSEKLNRVTPIDTMYQSKNLKPGQGPNGEDGYTGIISTREYKGLGDFYRWIIFINGIQSVKPFDLIINDDRLVDGNEIADWGIVSELLPGDFVEIHQTSISERAFHYWTLVSAQITNFGGPFDTPPAPVEGNVYNINDKDEKVLGFFGVSKVEKAQLLVIKK